ncbi:MAG TPA: multidrug effflux MFS transporter [Alphaproteobacteria bacterium]
MSPDTGKQATRAASSDAPPSGDLRPPPLLVLVLSTAISSLALHMVLPALPEMAFVFGIPPGDIGFVVTTYLIGLSAAQLIVGPLSDRFGRRPVLLAGTGLYIAMTLLCIATPSTLWLLIARALQAFGGCAGMVLGRTIIRDCYPRDRAASGMGYLTVALATGSMLAPGIGAFIIHYTGWRGVFVTLAAIGVAALITSWRYLPETNRFKLERLDTRMLVRNYQWLLRSRTFLKYALATSCQLSSWFAFVTIMPAALVAVFHQPATAYGLWVLLPMTGYVLGNAAVGRLSTRVGGTRLIQVGLAISAIGAAAMVVGAMGLVPGPLAFFGPMAIIVVGNGLVTPNANVAAISVNPAIMGAASGLLGFFLWTMSVFSTATVSFAGTDNLAALAAVVVGGNLIAIVLLLRVPR